MKLAPEIHGVFDGYEADIAAAYAKIGRLRELLKSIERTTAPGSRTLDDLIRDMGFANDLARTALKE